MINTKYCGTYFPTWYHEIFLTFASPRIAGHPPPPLLGSAATPDVPLGLLAVAPPRVGHRSPPPLCSHYKREGAIQMGVANSRKYVSCSVLLDGITSDFSCSAARKYEQKTGVVCGYNQGLQWRSVSLVSPKIGKTNQFSIKIQIPNFMNKN
jgi:hypothetical protein